MADIITTLHPEGVPEDDLYPNIKKENLPTQLQPVADFALSEYKKTLNIWDEVWESGSINSNTGLNIVDASRIRSRNYIKVLPNQTYFFQTGTSNIESVYLYGANHEFLGTSGTFWGRGSVANEPRDIPSNCHYIRFRIVATTYNHDITISEGDHSVGYQPYNGKVMHTIDCQGVLLWENGDPSSVFANQSITVLNINDYSYLEIEYKYNKDLRVSQVMRVSTSLTAGTDSEFIISCSNQDQASNVASRSFIIQNDTTIYVGSGGFNGNVNQAYIIPVAIYGIK